MQFLLEKITTIFAISLLMMAMFTSNWSKIKYEVNTKEEKGSATVSFGLFNVCNATEGTIIGQKSSGKECKSWSDMMDDSSNPDEHDLNKHVKTCKILAIIALIMMVLSFTCEFIPGCDSKHVPGIMLILSSVLLITCLIIWSQKIYTKLPSYDQGNEKGEHLKETKNYGYSYYLLVISAVLTMASGVANFTENTLKK